MRRIALSVLLLTAGCNRQHLHPPDQSDPDAGDLASIIHTADPRTARQLLTGFHGVDPSGRWTQRSFSVRLRVPALTDPALWAHMYLPESQVARLGPVKLMASVNGVPLEPVTLEEAGQLFYVRRIPASALATTPAQVEFGLDKWMPAGTVESRELGVMFIAVGLKNGLSAEPW